MLGSDDTNDVRPSRVEGVAQPVHQLTLVAMGMPLFDNLDLESVAEEAGRQNRWEFMLVAAPLAVEGGTGSPLNPLAIFCHLSHRCGGLQYPMATSSCSVRMYQC